MFRAKSSQRPEPESSLARSFSKLIFQGKCGAALNLLKENRTTGTLREDDVLPSGETNLKVQTSTPQGLKQEALLSQNDLPSLTSLVIFKRIDADAIRHAAIHTKGAAGPSTAGEEFAAPSKKPQMSYVIL